MMAPKDVLNPSMFTAHRSHALSSSSVSSSFFLGLTSLPAFLLLYHVIFSSLSGQFMRTNPSTGGPLLFTLTFDKRLSVFWSL